MDFFGVVTRLAGMDVELWVVDQAERGVNAKGPVIVIMETGTAKNDIRAEPPFDFVEEQAAGAAQCADSNSNSVDFHEHQSGRGPAGKDVPLLLPTKSPGDRPGRRPPKPMPISLERTSISASVVRGSWCSGCTARRSRRVAVALIPCLRETVRVLLAWPSRWELGGLLDKHVVARARAHAPRCPHGTRAAKCPQEALAHGTGATSTRHRNWSAPE